MEGSQLSGELQCVGRLEIAEPKPFGFLCGTLPILTDEAYRLSLSGLVPSPSQRVIAPRYRMIPTEFDLNTPPCDMLYEGTPSRQTLARRCESLTVFGIAEFGDEIDVVAPTDILKQIFKIPYSKARVSVAVQRVGQTLILNPGPDAEEGEKLVRRQNNQSKAVDQSLFLNFAKHSVRVEACDCPPSHAPRSTVLPGHFESSESLFVPSPQEADGSSTHIFAEPAEEILQWDGNNNKNKSNRRDVLKKTSEKPHGPVQESDKWKRIGTDGFLRVLFWQFHNFRMLLGSDLLLFSNEKHVSVSLHLWDVSRQVTPMTWLEAWIDNVMASVPELAICYHRDGVVQGYELLKTNDIFLLKGLSEDGTPAFHPQVVQQNGLSVLKFLEENCKEDPGAYWLYKSAGEDVIQLYDLSVIPKTHSPARNDEENSLPSFMQRGKRESVFSLSTLLYRLAHRLSLSKVSSKRTRCAAVLRKCLNFMEGQDHLVVRAHVHEQFARLILKCCEELDLTTESFCLESDSSTANIEDSLDSSMESQDKISSLTPEYSSSNDRCRSSVQGLSVEDNEYPCVDKLAVYEVSKSSNQVVGTISDPISSKLAVIHHVTQAIQSLRWKRQLGDMEAEILDHKDRILDKTYVPSQVCGCGDPDCIEVCDIRDWVSSSKFDHKLWKLVLLLGESYLALGQAYKEDGQLRKALKVVDLACTVYGSVPQHVDNAHFISSMICSVSSQLMLHAKRTSVPSKLESDDCLRENQMSLNYLFWAKVWTLVGDVYVDYHVVSGKEIVKKADFTEIVKKEGGVTSGCELKIPSEVVEEVKRLKKKLGPKRQNCNLCSLVNCSCQNDRASSSNSASSSTGNVDSIALIRKQTKKANGRFHKQSGNNKGVNCRPKDEHVSCSDGTHNSQKSGGIFRYLEGPVAGNTEYNLSAAVSCYDSARKAMQNLPTKSVEVESLLRKKGWACNELGRNRLENQGLEIAERAFIDAIKAFNDVSDHDNIILINCNLGHGRRALAESIVSKVGIYELDRPLSELHKQFIETAKNEYCTSLRYYGAARSELRAAIDRHVTISDSLSNEVNTQVAHTYLRLGMLLAREKFSAEVYESIHIDTPISSLDGLKKELRKREISANEAIREALCTYESMGALRRQEAAFAYFQLASYHRDCCLRYRNVDTRQINLPKDDGSHKVKQYASLAERNWQKSIDFYGPESHPTMHLTILMERSALSFQLFSFFHMNTMLESALSNLLDARHVNAADAQLSDVREKFWAQLQGLLKSMLSIAMSNIKSTTGSTAPSNSKFDVGKLRELYRMSLKSSSLSQLNAMHVLWSSQ